MELYFVFKEWRLTVYMDGELDHHTASQTMRKISEKIDIYLPRDCVLDFERVRFMDSSGIAVIIKAYHKMRQAGGRLWGDNVGKQPLKVIDAAGLDRIINIGENAQ